MAAAASLSVGDRSSTSGLYVGRGGGRGPAGSRNARSAGRRRPHRSAVATPRPDAQQRAAHVGCSRSLPVYHVVVDLWWWWWWCVCLVWWWWWGGGGFCAGVDADGVAAMHRSEHRRLPQLPAAPSGRGTVSRAVVQAGSPPTRNKVRLKAHDAAEGIPALQVGLRVQTQGGEVGGGELFVFEPVCEGGKGVGERVGRRAGVARARGACVVKPGGAWLAQLQPARAASSRQAPGVGRCRTRGIRCQGRCRHCALARARLAARRQQRRRCCPLRRCRCPPPAHAPARQM